MITVTSGKTRKPAVKQKLLTRAPLSKKGTRVSVAAKKPAKAKPVPFKPTLQPLTPPTPSQPSPKVEEATVKPPVPAEPGPALNAPLTKEQQNGIPAVIGDNMIEGVRRIDHLPLKDQIDQVFNPLHGLTKTAVNNGVTDSTYVVPEGGKREL